MNSYRGLSVGQWDRLEQTMKRFRAKGPAKCALKGKALLVTPQFNKGSAFSQNERNIFELHGLLPSASQSLQQQVRRAKVQYDSKNGALGKNTFMASLKDQNQVLYFRLLTENIKEMFPIVYTPTEGEAIEEYSHIFRRPDGCFLSVDEPDQVEERLTNWGTRDDIDYIVVSDGEEILGIGDQGVGGIGISSAKLVLMTLCAGLYPNRAIPVVLDVGTNSRRLLEDDLYLGLKRNRASGEEYDKFLDRFVQSVKKLFPNALLHFEDFGVENAWRLLSKYRPQLACFNDDIQGTAAVTLAALTAALQLQHKSLGDARILIYGAGSAGCGIADGIKAAMVVDSVSEKRATQQFWLVDKQGLLSDNMTNLSHGQRTFARPAAEIPQPLKNLVEIVTHVKPDVLIGCSTQAKAFTEQVVREMAKHVDRPVILPLSNPTKLHEAIPSDIFSWTDGKALVATGSPFDPVSVNGKSKEIAECNNALAFPGIGLGCVLARVEKLTDEMLFAGSKALAGLAPALKDPSLALLPDVTDVREVSLQIAIKVIEKACEQGLAREDGIPKDSPGLRAWVEEQMWEPAYQELQLVDSSTGRRERGEIGVGSS